MVKVNEIRVGNWFNDIMAGKFQVSQADITEWEAINCLPITLTPDVLEQFGFEKGAIGYYWLYKIQLCVYYNNGGTHQYSISLRGNLIRIGIRHLHQLQNICFALTGEELEMMKEKTS